MQPQDSCISLLVYSSALIYKEASCALWCYRADTIVLASASASQVQCIADDEEKRQ